MSDRDKGRDRLYTCVCVQCALYECTCFAYMHKYGDLDETLSVPMKPQPNAAKCSITTAIATTAAFARI